MKLAIALLLCVVSAWAQQQQRMFGYYNQGTGWKYGDIVLDPTLVLTTDGLGRIMLKVLVPPPPPVKAATKILAYDPTTSGWPLPTGATNPRVYVNGLRYAEGVDYKIESGVVKPLSVTMQPDFIVLCDFEQ